MLVVSSLHTETRSFSNSLPHLHFGCLLSSCLYSSSYIFSTLSLPSPFRFPSSLWSFLLHIFPSLLTPLYHPHTPLFSASLSSLPPATLLPFILLPPSSLSPLACPTAERLQSEPFHLFSSLLLYKHPQNALMRYRESRLWPQQVSARPHPHLAASRSACASCFYAFDEVMETVLWDVTQGSRSGIIM